MTFIPEVLKKTRTQEGLTLDDLAEKSGVSRSMISKIERGQAVPSTTVLGRLAEALDLSITQFVGGQNRDESVHVPAKKQPVFVEEETGFQRRSLSPLYRGRGVDFAKNMLPAGQRTGPFPSHRAGVEEHIYVHSGVLRVHVGHEVYDLEEGDFLFYPADQEHTFENPGTEPAEFFIVIDSTHLR
ncbi:MAG: helix-turn-helix domain-containing protein [Terasakiella sp.]|uniref:helix-turn-helix domain-containing protein n=1 Tax=unclassified Terasakiella TaxID=2614952 RepID=UPI003AFFF72C